MSDKPHIQDLVAQVCRDPDRPGKTILCLMFCDTSVDGGMCYTFRADIGKGLPKKLDRVLQSLKLNAVIHAHRGEDDWGWSDRGA